MECFTQDASMLGERLAVPLRAELVQQLARALDVGEEQRDSAGGEISSHECQAQTLEAQSQR